MPQIDQDLPFHTNFVNVWKPPPNSQRFERLTASTIQEIPFLERGWSDESDEH